MGPHTREKLAQDLRDLGVEPGDILFIHSSFKSLGPVEGGAATVIAALEEALGREGLILMPSFNLVDNDKRAATWNVETSPATTGWLTEFFRQMAGTYRSDHYSHSVAARGKGAGEFVSNHLSREGYKSPWDKDPWGYTYGTNSPMYKAYLANGKILMIGVDYYSSTYGHLVEVTLWNRRLENDPNAEYPWLKRPELGAFWDRTGNLRRGHVGSAPCRLFRIREYVDALVEEVERNPDPYVKRW
jgi:aminoglycoside N3'-acetyltransferase